MGKDVYTECLALPGSLDGGCVCLLFGVCCPGHLITAICVRRLTRYFLEPENKGLWWGVYVRFWSPA